MEPIHNRARNILSGLIVVLLLSSSILVSQKRNDYAVKSPDGAISLKVEAGAKLEWSVQDKGQQNRLLRLRQFPCNWRGAMYLVITQKSHPPIRKRKIT